MQMTDETTLAGLRKRCGLTQAQVAQRMGVRELQVSRIEAAYPEIMFPTLRRYLDALEMEIRYTGDQGIDFSSSEVVEDVSRRGTVETRRKDPTRKYRK